MKKINTKITIFILGFIFLNSCSGDDSSTPQQPSCDKLSLNSVSDNNFAKTCGIAIDHNGTIAISTYNGFTEGYGAEANIYLASNLSNLFAGNYMQVLVATAPEALAFDKDGNLYVSETEAVAGIKVFKKEGNDYIHHKTIQSGFNNPRGLAFDNQNRLYLADDGNGRIVRFNDPFSSNDFEIIATPGVGVKGVAINGDYLYVANFNQGTVSQSKIESDGSLGLEVAKINVDQAIDVSANDGKIVITSYEKGSSVLVRACNFTNEGKTEYFDLGKTFGTIILDDSSVLCAVFGDGKIKSYQLN